METIDVTAVALNPGGFLVILFSDLVSADGKRKLDPDEWGLCVHNDCYWLGEQGLVEGKPILRLPFLQISDQRNNEYPEWGDEEVYLVVKRDDEDFGFKWFLLDQEEMAAEERKSETRQTPALN